MASLLLATTSLSAGGTAAATNGVATWNQLSPSTMPEQRAGTSMAFDPDTNQMLMFGGYDFDYYGTHVGELGDTWTWDGSNWTEQFPAVSPSPRQGANMAYDASTGQMILFGGVDRQANYLADTWIWNGSTWNQLSPASSPSPRYNASMAYDPATNQLVLFGGYNSTDTFLADTWVWDGSTWTQMTPDNSPSARYWASMAFDPNTNQVLLFGGSHGGDLYNDTWTWDGTTWNPILTATEPDERYNASMAFDPETNQMILFGGYTSGVGYRNDTWAWDGTRWSELYADASPAARYWASMAFDPSSDQMLLFGGSDGKILGDMWNLDVSFTSTSSASLVAIGNRTFPIFAFFVTAPESQRVMGQLVYRDSTVQLSYIRPLSLEVGNDQATIYGTAVLSDGTAVSFTLEVSKRSWRPTIRLQLSNGYDTGIQVISFARLKS